MLPKNKVFANVKRVLALSALVISGSGYSATTQFADGGLFLDYLVMREASAVCSDRFPGFAQRFAPAFAKWQTRRAAQLERGPTALEAVGKSQGVDYDSVVRLTVDKLNRSPAVVVQKECGQVLESLGVE